MSIQHIATDKIIHVTVNKSRLSFRFVWKDYAPPKTFLGIVISKEKEAGWRNYDDFSGDLVTEDYIFNKSLYKNSLFKKSDTDPHFCIYEKPSVNIVGRYHSATQFFSTDEEAEKYAEEIAEKFTHITIKK